MRKGLVAAGLAASVMAFALASGQALAFSMQGSSAPSADSSSSSGASAGSNLTDPDEKLLRAPLGGNFQAQPDGSQSVHFGDKNGGLTLQATPAPVPSGANRYFSMETNPWR